ncbi:hypothetical protein HZA38_05785 [Candidatus Peregrinibacteria bacterium]|nr:hypothetical protein [Candidatus Peregrinibacteria bacterium]
MNSSHPSESARNAFIGNILLSGERQASPEFREALKAEVLLTFRKQFEEESVRVNVVESLFSDWRNVWKMFVRGLRLATAPAFALLIIFTIFTGSPPEISPNDLPKGAISLKASESSRSFAPPSSDDVFVDDLLLGEEPQKDLLLYALMDDFDHSMQDLEGLKSFSFDI